MGCGMWWACGVWICGGEEGGWMGWMVGGGRCICTTQEHVGVYRIMHCDRKEASNDMLVADSACEYGRVKTLGARIMLVEPFYTGR
jgi:hypothetical protein